MSGDERRQLRRAYEIAKTLERAYRERYYPVKASGSRKPEEVTHEVLGEFERLEAATKGARVDWQASLRG